MEESLQPQETDLVLGGNPVTSAVLGGIAGLRYRLTNSPVYLKVELLTQSQNYGEAGIDLLREYVTDSALIVRAKACQLLQAVDDPEARDAIAQGLLLNPGDAIFEVYESVICYNDWCYDLMQSYQEIEDYGYPLKLISQHVCQSSAQKSALLHHQWRAIQLDECNYLPQIGWDEYRGIRATFDIVDWCLQHQVSIRLPGESQSDFAQRLDMSDYYIERTNKLKAEHQAIDREFSREEFQEEPHDAYGLGIQKPWNLSLRKKLEERAIALLQATQQYELLAQLWLDAVGKLAFVHQKTITEPTYIEITQNL